MTRLNERIRAPKVRVVYESINMVLPTKEALGKAKALGLDLVEIAPNADPPVCKIVDYGKYKYDLSKQQKAAPKTKNKTKEVKFRINIGDHDYEIKMTRAEDFLDHGDKLRIQLQFRGRENAHRELGFELMKRIAEDLKTMAKVDIEPKLSGRQIVMMMSPLPEAQRERKFRVEIPDDYVDEDEFHDDDEEHHDDHDHHEEEGHDFEAQEEKATKPEKKAVAS
ncbi:MAG: translation initiation factor IF-3 [Verrucomicrobiota bacterium]